MANNEKIHTTEDQWKAIEAQHDQLVSELSLQFVEPTSEQVNALEDKLKRAAQFLGVKCPPLELLKRGILTQPLTEEQMNRVATELDLPYGSYFTQLQDTARKTPIIEAGEKMVDIRETFATAGVAATFSNIPINPAAGKEWGGKPRVFWAREGVTSLVLKAAEAFREIGITLHFEDGFRPEGVQEGLFRSIWKIQKEQHPNLDNTQLLDVVGSMIAFAPWNAGHKSGAAVDYTLRTLDGKPLDLGHQYLQLGAKVALNFPFLIWEQVATRRLFEKVSEMAGLSVYPGEDWHVSDADTLAAMVRENPQTYATKYAAIKSFDLQTGAIIPADPAKYYENFPLI